MGGRQWGWRSASPGVRRTSHRGPRTTWTSSWTPWTNWIFEEVRMEDNVSPTMFQGKPLSAYFDLGHQGDVDYTLIDKMLALTPTERLRHHERWRVLLVEGGVPNFLEDMVGRLTQAGVEFVIVGGVSAVLQGSNLTTRDLDIC